LTTETGGNGATNGDASRVARLCAVPIPATFNLRATSWTVSHDDGANSAEIVTMGDLVVKMVYAGGKATSNPLIVEMERIA
jgi:hypothetical protein